MNSSRSFPVLRAITLLALAGFLSVLAINNPADALAEPNRKADQKAQQLAPVSPVGSLGKILGDGGIRAYGAITDGQKRQVVAYLDKAADPVGEFLALGRDKDSLEFLRIIFRDLGADAAKPYLAKVFLILCGEDKVWPPDESNFTWIHEAFYRGKLFAELRPVISEHVKENAESPRAIADCGFLESMLDRPAISPLFDNALGKVNDPKDRAVILGWKGRHMQFTERYAEAISCYEQSLALQPGGASTWNLIEVLGKKGDKSKLDAVVNQTLERVPREAHATHDVAGRAYKELKDYATAESHFKECLAHLPPGYENWNFMVRGELADLYKAQNRTTDARKAAEEALAFVAQRQQVAGAPEFDSSKKNLQQYADVSDMTLQKAQALRPVGQKGSEEKAVVPGNNSLSTQPLTVISDAAVASIRRHLMDAGRNMPLPTSAEIREMLRASNLSPKDLVIGIMSYRSDHDAYPTQLGTLTTPVAYLMTRTNGPLTTNSSAPDISASDAAVSSTSATVAQKMKIMEILTDLAEQSKRVYSEADISWEDFGNRTGWSDEKRKAFDQAAPLIRDLRQQAAKKLAALGLSAAPALLRVSEPGMVGNNDPDVFIEALAIQGRESMPVVIDALSDNDLRVRLRAIGVLERLNDPRATPALIGALKDADGAVALAAVRALIRVGDVSAGAALLDFRKTGAANESIRQSLDRALAQFGVRDATPFLIADLEKALEILPSEDNRDYLVGESIGNLFNMGDPAAIPALEKALEKIKALPDGDTKKRMIGQADRAIEHLRKEPRIADRVSTSPLESLGGQAISAQEADAIVQKIRAHIYSPVDHIQTFRCEFKPEFIDWTPMLLDNAARQLEQVKSRGGRPEDMERANAQLALMRGVRICGLVGMEFFPFVKDDGLSKARKAVFFFEKIDAETNQSMTTLDRWPAVLLLYDGQGNEIPLHPALKGMFGAYMLNMLGIYGQEPLGIPKKPDLRSETQWLMEKYGDGATLYWVSHFTGTGEGNQWNSTRIDYSTDFRPLEVDMRMWDRQRGAWKAMGRSRKFVPLAGTNLSASAGTAEGSGLEYEWKQLSGQWLVAKVRGTRRDPATAERGKTAPFEIALEQIEVNQPLPARVLDFLKTEAVKLNLSSPDATVETVFECMRRGQEGLLPYCSVTPPKEPVKQNRPPTILAYWFEAFPNMKEGLRVASKTQMGNDWVYRIEIPQPLTAHRRGFDLKVKKVGAEYRIDADLGLLNFQFFD